MNIRRLLPLLALSACSASHTVITADENGHSLSRINDNGTVQVFPVPSMPHNVQISTDGKWLLATGMRMDHASGRHEASAGDLMIIDAAAFDAGTLRSIAVGGHPAHVITDVSGKIAYVTDSANDRIAIVDVINGSITGHIPVGKFPHGMRMNSSGSELYTANVNDDTVSVVDIKRNAEIHRIPVGEKPIQVAVSSGDEKLYVTLAKGTSVAVINLKTYKVLKTIPVPDAPAQIYADPKGRYMYVADQGSSQHPGNMLSVIDAKSDTLIKNIITGRMPHGVVADDEGRFVYVTNMKDNTVSKLAVDGWRVIQTYHVGESPNGITQTKR